jgi:hypothetical protein
MLLVAGAIQVSVFGIAYGVLVWRPEKNDPRDQARVSRYVEGIWEAWTYTADGGTHAKAYHFEQRALGFIITFCGIIYLAAVLAFIVDFVREKMDSMRVGKGQVLEEHHYVILHWTDRTIPLIQELCIANESDGGGVVVVLAKEPMETMSSELAAQLPKNMRYGTKIVCRFGNPAVVSDLIKVSADRAKAVVILASGKSADEADSSTLRCLLSIKSMGYKMGGHVVAEVRDVDNDPLLQLVGGKLIETFVSHDILGRLMLMSVRQLGIADVYDSMLGFEGNEFYMKAWPELNGLRWTNVAERFPKAVPIGLRTAAGVVHLNCSPDMVINEGDQLIVIAEEPRSYKPEQPAHVEAGNVPTVTKDRSKAEKVLICGWRRDIRDILKLLDRVVAAGSEVHTMTHSVPVEARNQQLLDEGLNVADLVHIRLVHQWGNTSSRRRLENLPLETYTSCLIFADQSYEEDTMQADSHSLATLVLIRDIQAKRIRGVLCPITCEVLDSRTQRTISGQKQLRSMSDFVQSNKFVARILAMVGENRSVRLILNELLGATGASLHIVPPSWYVHDEEKISFWSVGKRAAARGAVLIGYQEKKTGARQTILNPPDKGKAVFWDQVDLAIITGTEALGMDLQDATSSIGLGGALTNLEAKAERAEAMRAMNRGDRAADSPQTPAPGHQLVDVRGDEDATLQGEASVPEEGGVCASADTAASAMAKMASKCCQLMSEEERHRFADCLGMLGESVIKGIFPTMPHGAERSESKDSDIVSLLQKDDNRAAALARRAGGDHLSDGARSPQLTPREDDARSPESASLYQR